MIKRKLTIEDYLLILINLVPLYGVWFLGWDAKHIFIVYAMETVIVGLFNIIKMAIVTLFVKEKHNWQRGENNSQQSGWFFIFFFIIHYGFFVFIQTQLFFKSAKFGADDTWLFNYAKIPSILGNDGKIVLLIFTVYYAMQNFYHFFAADNYKKISMMRLMFEPYLRIFTQQIIVILGGMCLTFGAGKIFILVFVVVKVYMELFINYGRIMKIIDKKSNSDNLRN
jgi:hypothetical protein